MAIIDLDIHHGSGTEDIVRRYPHPSRLFFFCLHLFDEEHSAILNNSSENVITEHSEQSSAAFSHLGGKTPVPDSDEVRDVPSTQIKKEGIILHNFIKPLPRYLPTPIPPSFPLIPSIFSSLLVSLPPPSHPPSLSPSTCSASVCYLTQTILQTHQNTNCHLCCFFYFVYSKPLIPLFVLKPFYE